MQQSNVGDPIRDQMMGYSSPTLGASPTLVQQSNVGNPMLSYLVLHLVQQSNVGVTMLATLVQHWVQQQSNVGDTMLLH